MKSYFKAKQASDLMRQFLARVSGVPESVYGLLDTLVVIKGDKPFIPLSNRLEHVEPDVLTEYNKLPGHVQLLDYYTVVHALSCLHTNISKRIATFIDVNHNILFESIQDDISTDDYRVFLEIGFMDYYEAFYRSGEDREYVRAILRRFRYRVKEYQVVRSLLPMSEVESLENDLSFNFDAYKMQFYKYYYEFYVRGENPDKDIAMRLLSNSMDADKDHDGYKPYTVKFDIDLFKPIEHVMEELDDFKNAMYVMLTDQFGSDEFRYNSTNRFGYHFIKDYVRNNSGQIEERNDLSRLFIRWQRYLDIYDMLVRDGCPLKKVTAFINKKYPVTMAGKDEPTISNEKKAAIRLIESASNGTFPY